MQGIRTKAGVLEVRVVEASEPFLSYWAKHIQAAISQDRSRPDRNWDWPSLASKRTAASRLATLLGQSQKTYCIVAQDNEGGAFPIGMLHLVEKYRWVLDGSVSSAFIWYLAAAPKDMIDERFGVRPWMMSAFIDVGLVVSMNNGHGGRLFLHADPAGGQSLEDSYAKCGMMKTTPDAKISMVRKFMARHSVRATGAAGAYFYTDEEIARTLLNYSNCLRSYTEGGK